MRIGMFIGRFFVSATTTVLSTAPVWLTLGCLITAGYLVFFHTDNVQLLFLAGYLLFLGVLPAATLMLTGLTAIVLFIMWLTI